MKYKDYYETLQIKKTADKDEIKHAYRKLAKQYHPDSNIGDEEALEKIKEINEAYEVLGDPEKKRKYDSIVNRFNFISGFEFDPSRFGLKKKKQEFTGTEEGAFSEFFDMFFNNEDVEFEDNGYNFGGEKEAMPAFRKGEDIEVNADIELVEAYFGTSKILQIKERGNKIREVEVDIPAGILNGEKIRVVGKGLPGTIGSPPGDLFVKANIMKHDTFKLEGRNLVVDVPITPWEAVLGCTTLIPTIDGVLSVNIPKGIQSGYRLRIANKGYRQEETRGDLLAQIKIVVPTELSSEEKKLYEKLAAVSKFEPRKKKKIEEEKI